MEAAYAVETLVTVYQITRCHIAEERSFNIDRHENLKSLIIVKSHE
jgi:hypothetical protein